jgi:hypothetical protein
LNGTGCACLRSGTEASERIQHAAIDSEILQLASKLVYTTNSDSLGPPLALHSDG